MGVARAHMSDIRAEIWGRLYVGKKRATEGKTEKSAFFPASAAAPEGKRVVPTAGLVNENTIEETMQSP